MAGHSHRYVAAPVNNPHHTEEVDEGTPTARSSMPSESRLTRSALAWWWEEGPVLSCCCCFGLRTGIYLLAAWGLISSMIGVGACMHSVEGLETLRDKQEERFNTMCSDGANLGVKESACNELQEYITDIEHKIIVGQAAVVVAMLGACVAILGLVTAWTQKPDLVKYYAAVFALNSLFSQWVSTVSDVILSLFHLFFLLYYLKVLWSFYIRCRMEEELRSAGVQGSYVERVHLGLVRTVV